MSSGDSCRFGTPRSGLPEARKGLTLQVECLVIQMGLSVVWIGLVIGQQCFREVKTLHAALTVLLV